MCIPPQMGALISWHKVSIITAGEDQPEERLAAIYNRETILQLEVTADHNELDFDLSAE